MDDFREQVKELIEQIERKAFQAGFDTYCPAGDGLEWRFDAMPDGEMTPGCQEAYQQWRKAKDAEQPAPART